MKLLYKKLVILSVFSISISCSLENADLGEKESFVKFFDEGEGLAVEQTSDEGFILLGTFEEGEETQAQLIKTDDGGNLDWITRITDTFGRAVKILPSGGYILVGDRINREGIQPGDDPISEMVVITTDNSGTLQQEFTYAKPDRDVHGNTLVFDTDGNIIVLGTFEDAADFDQMFVTKLDINSLSQLWIQEYGVENKNNDTGKSIHINSNGEIIWSGSVFTQVEETMESFLRIYAALPDSETTNGIAKGDAGEPENFFAVDIQPTFTGFAIIGSQTNQDNTQQDLLLIRTDESGNIIPNSERTYREEFQADTEGSSIFSTSNNGLIILGERDTPLNDQLGKGGTDFLLIRTDGSGNIRWWKTIGGPGDEFGGAVRQTIDGGFVIFGTQEFQGLDRMVLVKTNPDGELN